VVPLAAQRLAEFGASAAAVVLVLDTTLRGDIEQALKECAAHARTQVLFEEMGGRSPSAEECNEMVMDKKRQRSMTRAMFLGQEMHRVALQCAGVRLETLRPGGFSLEQRYRYDPRTRKRELVSKEEAQELLRQWRGSELKGTIVPDIVLHEGNALWPDAAYDFKFPCASGSEATPWSTYPKGHPYQRLTQKDVYQGALGVGAWRVIPWFGILP